MGSRRNSLVPQVIGNRYQPYEDDVEEEIILGIGEPVDPGDEDYKRYQMELKRTTMSRTPKVPNEPAPPCEPPVRQLVIPSELLLPPKDTMIRRMLNSASGRGLTFALTFLLFGTSAFGLVAWQMPALVLANWNIIVLGAALLSTVLLFAMIPALARKSGMSTSPDGADWKPYLALYRLSFLSAMPALICLSMGYGQRMGFGDQQGNKVTQNVGSLPAASLKYFEAFDGFVALNLTKGITETREYTEHGYEAARRFSRFRDAELRINTEPYSDVPEPTVPPGALRMFRIAPIFASWAPCVDRYKISIACLQQNPVVGWAIAETKSICTSIRLVACLPPEPILDPVYRCSTDAIHGKDSQGEVGGLCGRVQLPPLEAAIDELRALLTMDGWPIFALPESSQLWIDVTPDDCIGNPDSCKAQWDLIGVVGAMFAVFTLVCIIAPGCMDCIVDERIRSARQIYDENEKRRPQNMI